MNQIEKNRNRSKFTFANINLLGKCNMNCYFCLGKDLATEFAQYNECLNIHFSKWNNWDKFVNTCKELSIPQIYITGQNTDSLCYRYIPQLVEYLKSIGFYVGIRTNGLLAPKYMDNVVNQCTTCWGDAVGYHIPTLKQSSSISITGSSHIPNWDFILSNTKAKMRVAIVLCKYNKDEILDIIDFVSKYPVEYVQVRRISTDTRYHELCDDINLFEKFAKEMFEKYPIIDKFESAEIYDVNGMKVSLWRTVSTSVNSINYFSNGVLSNEYFVIEGYAKQKGIILLTKENS